MSRSTTRRAGRRGLSGHARLLAEPAYEKLLAAEPVLKRAIPVLIIIFLSIVAFARFIQLVEIRDAREVQARETIAMAADIIAAEISSSGTEIESRFALQNFLANVAPGPATADGRFVFVTDKAGIVQAALPRGSQIEGRALDEIISDSQPLILFGARAGVLDVSLEGDRRAIATARALSGKLGTVGIVQSMEGVEAAWRRDVSLNASIFVATSVILLVILYAYFAQSTRAAAADRIYAQTHGRFDTALKRGRAGLWDWDLARGRMFWSNSMYEILGLEPRDALIGFGEVQRLIHPDDGDLMAFAEHLYDSDITTIDRMFRMRHANGEWIWLRARAEIADRDSGEPHLIGIAVDVTEQMRLAERSKTADIRLRDAIETISEAFVLWDADNRLVMCNTKYQQLHNLPDHAVVSGTHYEDVASAGSQPIVRARIPGEGRPEEGARSFEAQLEDGRWLQINERRTKDGGFVSVGTDITQIKRHEERLIEGERRLMATIADLRQSRQKLEQQAQQMVELAEKYAEEKDRAEEASRIKSEFLANISHELRTPLNAIIGFSEIMQSGMFGPLGSEKYVEYSTDIHQSGTYLLGVINDVLDMSRIEAGRFQIRREQLGLDDLIEESIRIVSTQAEEQGIEVAAETTSGLSLSADRRALKQIMINLLSNAVKFTPSGGRISVRTRQVGGAVLFAVKDNGIGIPRDAIAKLGRPFEQVENQFTKSHSGSGLGLAITRSLVEMHGGTMRIASEEGRGTVVSVRLPIAPPAEAGETADRAA